MKILDCERQGNIVRFYLGVDELPKWWGDDWDDAPWDCNAGCVYGQFVRSHLDVVFPYDAEIEIVGEDEFNTRWCKDDMRDRRTPMLLIRSSVERKIYMGDRLGVLNDVGPWAQAPELPEEA